jgi:hypothetical protein
MENGVAKLLEGIGVALGIIGLIGAFVVGIVLEDIRAFEDYAFAAAVCVFISGALSGLLLYAFGEILSLLQDIKNNTQKSAAAASFTKPNDDDIPQL